MAMDKDVTQVIEGVAAAKTIQALIRKYGDVVFAQMFLYTAEQYVKDLKTAGYNIVAPDPNATKTDADLGVILTAAGGLTFNVAPPGGANLTGTGHLTANTFTYQAATGQKVAPWKQLSTWGTGLIGAVGIADSMYDFLGLKQYKLIVAAAGASLLGDGVVRGLGVDGTITAPSGFDVSKQPAMQYLDPSVQSNLRALSERNNQLQAEVNALRGRATGTIQTAIPQVTVTELARNPNEALKQQQFMGTYPTYPAAAVPGNMQFMSKLQQLEKAFL